MSYLKNIGKSAAFAFPQTVKGKLDNLFGMGGQLTSADSREAIVSHFKDTRAILKDTYQETVTTGYNDAINAIKSGDFSEKEEKFDFELGNDDFGFDNFDDILGDDKSTPVNVTNNIEVTTSREPTKGDAIVAQTIARSNGAIANKLSDVAKTTAGIGEITSNLSRHQLVNQVGGQRAAISFYNASIQRSDRDYKFKETIQKKFYEQNITSLFAITQFTGELSDKMSRLIEGQQVVATATDLTTKIQESRNNPTANFSEMFDNNGGFDVSGYMNVMNKRLKNMIEEKTSMASMFSMSTVAEMAIESAFPKGFTDRMEKLNDYIGDLPAVLLTKLSSDGKQLQANEDSNPMTKMAGKLMEFFGAEISSGKQMDLGNYAKSQAVAFDGYSHRSLVEVIPTLLGDILGEVSAIGRTMGTTPPKGIKAYNYSTGVFVDTAQERQKLEASLQKRSLQGFELAALQRGADPTAQMNSLFDKMITEGFNYTGKNADERLEKLVNDTVDPAKLAELTEGLAQYRELLKNTDNKNQLRYDINASIIKGANVRTKGMHDILSSGEENIARFIYNSDGSKTVIGGNDFANAAEANRQRQLNGEAERGTGGARYGTVNSITESMNSFRTIQQEEQSKDQISKGGIFTNEDGNVTLKSIYQSPFKMAGRTADGARKLINNFIFGKEDENGERVSLIQRIKDGFFGDDGIFSGFIERVGNNSTVKSLKDKFNNLRTTLFGDGESEGLIKKKLRKAHGVFGAVFASVFPMDKLKELATGAVTKFANYVGVSDSDISSAGGLVGYFKKSIKSKLDSAGTYLFGTDDGEGGRTGGLFDSMYKKGQESLQYVSDNILAPLKEKLSNVFDTVKTKLNTAFEGIKVHFNGIFESLKTNLGNMFNGLKEYSKELFTDISENVLAPLKVKLIDAFDVVKAKGASVFENVKETLMENIFSPLKLAMFGEDGKSGFIGNFTNQFKEKLFNPFKERVGEIYNAAKSNIMDGFITPMKDALVGKLANSEGVRGIFGVVGDKMQAGVDYITDAFREKIFEPFSNFMTNPVTGVLPKLNNFLFNKDTGIFSSFSNYLFDEDKGIFTRLNKTLFTGENSYMGRLQHWLNNPTNGVLTNLFDKLNANTEIVKEHMKRIGADLNENIIQPIKKEMKIVWDFTKDYFMNEIMTPLKHEIKGMYHDAVAFMKKEVFEPLKGTLQPFIEEAKYQWRMMKTHFADILKSSGKSIGQAINESFILGFGKSFTDIMRDNVLDPIKDVLGSVKKFLVTSLGAMIKIPVNIIKETSNSLRERHKALGIEYKAKQPRSESDIAASTERAKAREERAEARKKANEERKVARLEARGLRAAAKAEEEKSSKNAKRTSNDKGTNGKNAKGKGISQDPVISNVKIQIDRLKGSSKGTISNIVEKTSESTSYLKRLYVHFTTPKHTTLNAKSSTKSSSSINGGLQEAVDQIKGKAKFAPATIAGISDSTHTINNTSKDIYQFITSNLQNVGFNTERMAIALGANLKGTAEKAHGKGLLGKLKSFIRSPISFITNIGKTLISGIANVATNIIKLPLTILKNSVGAISSILTAAADVFTTTIKSIGTVASGIASVVQETGKIAGKLLVGLTAAVTPMIKAIGEVTKTVSSVLIHVTTEFAKGVASAGSVIIKSAGSMFASLSKNLFSIGKDIIHAGGVVAKHLLVVGTEIVKMGAQIMKGIAKTAGSLIGGTLSAVTGGLRGGGRGSLVGALTPVYVVGGRLAATDGGASSFAEAKMGFNRKSGKYKAIKDNIIESKLFENMTEYKEKLLKGVANTSKSIKSLGGTIKKMALALGGGLSTVMTGLTGLSSAIPAILNNIPGAGMVKAGSAAVQGAVGGAVSNLIGRIRANPAAIIPKLKTALKAAGIGLIGLGINSIADKYLEEGTAKEVVKTGGGALQGAALGATIGSFIPVVGTAIGAVVGGIGGALYENKDHILKWAEDSGFIDDLKNDWKIIKTKGGELAEMTAKGMESFAQSGIDFTKAAIEKDKQLIKDLKNDWNIIKYQSKRAMNFVRNDWDQFKMDIDTIVSVTKTTWGNITTAIADDWDKFKAEASELADITRNTWNNVSNAMAEDWKRFKVNASELATATKQYASETWGSISKFASEAWAKTVNIATEMWNGIGKTANKVWNDIADTAKGVWNKIAGWWPFGKGSDGGDTGGSKWWQPWKSDNTNTSGASVATASSPGPILNSSKVVPKAKANTIPVTLAKPTNNPKPTPKTNTGWGLKFPVGNSLVSNFSNTSNYSDIDLGNSFTNSNSDTDYSIGANDWDNKYPSSTSTYGSNFAASNLSSALTSNFANSNSSLLINNFSDNSGRASIGNAISEKASSIKNSVSNKIHGTNVAQGGNYASAPKSQGAGYAANRELIAYAAQASGVPLDLMLQVAAVESDFRPKAGAGTSSAKGLFQFIDGTWGDMKRKYGKKFGIPNNAHQYDPVANALLGGAFLRENSEGITTIKDNASSTDLYLAHFLGLGGAKRFLRGLNDNPEQDARNLVKSNVPGANKSIFFDNGKPRSARGVYEDLARRVTMKAEQHGLATPTGNGYTPGSGGEKSDDGGLFGILGAMGSAVLSPIKAITSGITGVIGGVMKAITKTSEVDSVDENTDMEYDGADGTPINRSTLGKFADGGTGSEYIKFGKNSISLDGVQGDTKNRFVAMAQAYHAETGRKLQVNSAYRSFKQQERLYKTMPKGMAARPGRSMHNYGYALDVQSAHANELHNSGLLAKFGFHRPVSGEAWHVEDATINRNAVRKRGMNMYTKGNAPEPVDNAQRNGESEGVAVGGKGFMPSNSMGLSSSFSPTNGLYSKYYDDGTEQAPKRDDSSNGSYGGGGIDNSDMNGISTDESPMGKFNPFINLAKDISGLFSKDKSKRPDISSIISSGSASVLTIMDMINGNLSMTKDYQNPNENDNKPYVIPEVGVSTADKMMYPDLYAGRSIDPNLDKIEANQTVGVQTNSYQASAIDTDRTTTRLNPLPLVSTMTDTSAMENSSNAELKNMINDLQRYLVANSNNTTLETNNKPRSNNRELSEIDLLAIIADKISVLASGNSAKAESNPNINKTTQRLSRDNSASLFNISANSLMVAAQS